MAGTCRSLRVGCPRSELGTGRSRRLSEQSYEARMPPGRRAATKPRPYPRAQLRSTVITARRERPSVPPDAGGRSPCRGDDGTSVRRWRSVLAGRPATSRHGCFVIRERKGFGRGVDCSCQAGGSLRPHGRAGLHSRHQPVDGLVRAGSGPNVDYRARTIQGGMILAAMRGSGRRYLAYPTPIIP